MGFEGIQISDQLDLERCGPLVYAYFQHFIYGFLGLELQPWAAGEICCFKLVIIAITNDANILPLL